MIAPPARSTARWRLVATASLLALFAGCRAPVLEGLDEATANDLVAALAQAGIDARKAGDAAGHRVEVDEDRLADAWSAARAAGFPRAEAAEPPARLIASPAETQALDRARRGRQLAELLRFDPRVLDARVAPGDDGAAVAVRVTDSAALPIAEVQTLIATPLGLDPSRVAVSVHAVPPPDTHGAAANDAPSIARPGWPFAVASAAAIGLAVICLLLLMRLRRLRLGDGRA